MKLIDHELVLTYLLTYLLTYSLFHFLYGAGYYLKSWLSLSFSKDILLSLWDPKVHYRVRESPPLVPILARWIQSMPSHPTILKLILILSYIYI